MEADSGGTIANKSNLLSPTDWPCNYFSGCMASPDKPITGTRSEEHTSELQSPCNLVCRLLLEKKKNQVEQDRFIPRHRFHYPPVQLIDPLLACYLSRHDLALSLDCHSSRPQFSACVSPLLYSA